MPKGVYLKTKEHKKRLSESLKNISYWKNKKFSKEHRQHISDVRRNKKHSLETRKKCRESRLKYLDAHPEIREKLRKFNKNFPPGMKGKHLTEETKDKIRKVNIGHNNPNWKGGISSITTFIHELSQYRYWRQQVFIRDNFTCQKCGIRPGCGHRIILEAHHIVSVSRLVQEVKEYMPLINIHDACQIYTPLWNINNGITLCNKCHRNIKIAALEYKKGERK